MCLEERVFYRLLSGMHASISLHLAHRWYNATADAYLPNATEFLRRFAPEHTAGEGPARLRNLYFTYSTVLRAIVKAQTMWESYPLFGEARDRDGMSTRAAVMQLVQTAQTCDRTFDEHALFQDPESAALADELRAHLRHVSRLMDCVGCRKCRLWGKLQVRGLATALKILFTPFDDLHPDTPLVLARNDVVALFNLWERLASSISRELEQVR
ncbi:uncharacterized protein MONBRDRAFT_8928 [Monosiga brevicollis MX1]|uniref:Endoplasmic reticulum oxidoreductin 1 n=1 Tax=Monosiga brevicollis TaxID=81824 RepID=A9V1J6_MONBE|nr:uncharacterized protein MONBRDRAFT_8928 [Monosiga brevicollis MX1]EDQ88452.1 predicted protein [Monosiga brevicollis MX1]|eukprot:XP_001746556.1 hypothetical protein [Monosiga brevicollis MX1]